MDCFNQVSTPSRMDTENVLIRPGKVEDMAEVRELMKELISHHNLTGEAADLEVLIRDGFTAKKRWFEIIVAVIDDAVIGFAMYYPSFATGGRTMDLENLYVKSEYRNYRIGYKLMREVAKVAIELGCRRINVLVANWNRAKNFYTKLGAEDVSATKQWNMNCIDRTELEKLVA